MLRPNQYFHCLGLISIYFVHASQRILRRFEIWKQVLTLFFVERPLSRPRRDRWPSTGDENKVFFFSTFLLCILSFTKRLTNTKLETLTFLALNIFLLTGRSFWIGKYVVFS